MLWNREPITQKKLRNPVTRVRESAKVLRLPYIKRGTAISSDGKGFYRPYSELKVNAWDRIRIVWLVILWNLNLLWMERADAIAAERFSNSRYIYRHSLCQTKMKRAKFWLQLRYGKVTRNVLFCNEAETGEQPPRNGFKICQSRQAVEGKGWYTLPFWFSKMTQNRVFWKVQACTELKPQKRGSSQPETGSESAIAGRHCWGKRLIHLSVLVQ